MAREVEGVEAHLLVALGGVGMAGRRVVDGEAARQCGWARRLWCSGGGTGELRGWRASLGHGEAC